MKIEKDSRVMAGILIVFVIFVIANVAYSSERHHRVPLPNLTEKAPDVTNIYNEYVTQDSGEVLGFAAAQCHLTQSHHLAQWCIGAANHKEDSAIVFQGGQKFDNTLLNFSIGVKDGSINLKDAAIGIGASGMF